MNMPDLREEDKEHLIQKIIKEKATSNECILWQDFTHSKVQMKVTFNSFVDGQPFIVFDCPEDPNIHFNPALPIYFYESNKECVFKTKITSMDQQIITLDSPTEILTLENRVFPRTIPDKDQEVTFSLNGKNGETLFSKRVLDYSEQGMAFKIIGREYLHFYEGDKLHFKKESCDIPIPADVGTIVYSKKIEDGKLLDKIIYRVGICFN